MNKIVFRILWTCFLLLCALGQPAFGADTGKKRVALFDFDYGTVHRWWAGEWDIGKGIADMVVTNLVRDGTFSVIERKQLDKILAEQNFTNTDRANPATAAKIGKVLGVNAIVIGTITQFGLEDKKVGTGGFSNKLGGVLGHVGTQKGKASVVIDARMVDTETAEILAVASGKGISTRSGLDLAGVGGGSGGGIDMSSSNFQETIIGEATRQAVDDVTRQLVEQADKIQATTIEVKGVVADVNENNLVLNVGQNQGLKVGDVLAIERVIRQVKDPTTGEVIRTVTQAIGTAKITSVDARSSEAVFSGVGQPKVGDAVKPKK